MSTLNRQGWYHNQAGEMEKFCGAIATANTNKPGILREHYLVGSKGEYEYNMSPLLCNFCQIEQNVPPNTKVEFDIAFNTPKFALLSRTYKDTRDGTAQDNAERVFYNIDATKSFSKDIILLRIDLATGV